MKNPLKAIRRRIEYQKSDEKRQLDFWYDLPVNDKYVMLEPGRGEQTSGSMFALLKEIETNPEFEEFIPFFIVTDGSIADAERKIKHYGFKKVRTVKRMTDDYFRMLATCKYFFSDNTYPAEFCKKPDQILANTWHGTPLKKMGTANIDGGRGLGNVQRNYFMADYALHPNEFTRDVFLDDYKTRWMFSGECVLLDYPRNDGFWNDDLRKQIRVEQGVDDLQVIAYMPTWRGVDAKTVSSEDQLKEVKDYLLALDSKIDHDRQILYVNMHPFVGKQLDFSDYEHLRTFPPEYETYDFLNIADVLITDYSSVMFDYAETGRPVYLFTYDLDDYMSSRGVYFGLGKLPFPQCMTVDELFDCINTAPSLDYTDFLKEFCSFRDPGGLSASYQYLSLVLNGKDTGVCRERIPHEQEAHILACKDLDGGLSDDLRKAIAKWNALGEHVVITFEGGIKNSYLDALHELNTMDGVDYYSLVGGRTDRDMPREIRRIFPGWHVEGFNKMSDFSQTSVRILHHLIPVHNYDISLSGGALTISFTADRTSFLQTARLGDREYELRQAGNRYSFDVPVADLSAFKARNKIRLADCFGIEHKIIARRAFVRKRKMLQGKLISLPDDMVCYLQEYYNGVDLLVRRRNVTDGRGQRFLLFLAYLLSKLGIGKRSVVLYEKNSEYYEESAAVVYEKLLDNGYKDVYFILDKNSPHWKLVPDRYRANLLPKYSFKHYSKLFRAKTIISTEMVSHSIEQRPISAFAKYWLQHAGFNYVWLQHGPTYMISLDAEGRSYYKQNVRAGYKTRTVVSSELEAQHFIECGKYDPEALYLCGMPNFDRADRTEPHDKIVIMPTWRPWESVAAAEDFTRTSYYALVKKMYDAVPEDLKDRVVILPHPLIKRYVLESNNFISDHMLPDLTHADVIRMADTLITDYSSISYLAFYMGCNVAFYWEEKEDSVSHYGPSARLMLTEGLAFGDVCYTPDELSRSVAANYGSAPSAAYEDRFRRIISFHDGENTERLIGLLKKDGLI